MTNGFWTLNEHGYFDAPGLSALVFHNAYPEGKQGGVELIQHGERIATCGDLRLSKAPGQWDVLPEMLGRDVAESDPGSEALASVTITGQLPGQKASYTLVVEPDGRSLRVSVDLDEPLPEPVAERLGFNLEIYPGSYCGKSFVMGDLASAEPVRRLFPQQANGPRLAGTDEGVEPAPLAEGSRFVAAPEDPMRRFEIASETGSLVLYDGRAMAQNGWFVLRELVAPGATTDAIVWIITPNADLSWRREPVIAVSQVGYHPEQVKQAIFELDARTETLENVVLERLESSGTIEVLSGVPERWGRFLRYDYAVFDFTAVHEPGLYRVRYGKQVTSPFEIHPQVYHHDVWQPTLATFLPVQMCHVTVKDRYQTWHGACHLDDALQAPAPHSHFDGYQQSASTDTAYEPYVHIPHLDRGGWHDAGDYDLAAGSQARTTHTLALIRDLFAVDLDQTTVDQEAGVVLLHTPDGVPDIVEQVAHGVENLLGGYQAAGHSFQGIIANSIEQYVHLGDASTMTDNCIYDPELALEESEVTPEGCFSGEMDDRWAFTNRDTALEYLVAGALAASSRVLKDHLPALAETCLRTAVGIWDYEHSHEPVSQPGAYVPRGVEAQEVLAAAELLLTTGEARYGERLLALRPTIESQILRLGGPVARTLPVLNDKTFAAGFREAVAAAIVEFEGELRTNPFGIHFHPHIWGIGWQLLGYAVQLYQLWLAFPELIDREMVLRVVNFNLGCHPASSTSLVSGVGANSATVAYGINREDWSYVPGGVISGPALIRPDFPELKEPWPYLWQQTEYVIGGAANYIFCILAADRMLNPQD